MVDVDLYLLSSRMCAVRMRGATTLLLSRAGKFGKTHARAYARSIMDEVWTDDTLESGSEREGGGLLSDEDGAESSEPEAAAVVTVKKRNARAERKKDSLFAWFPTPKAEETTDDYGRQNYKVYRWRWFMLVTMFLLNISNGTVSRHGFLYTM